jgi:hypothetical protein
MTWIQLERNIVVLSLPLVILMLLRMIGFGLFLACLVPFVMVSSFHFMGKFIFYHPSHSPFLSQVYVITFVCFSWIFADIANVYFDPDADYRESESAKNGIYFFLIGVGLFLTSVAQVPTVSFIERGLSTCIFECFINSLVSSDWSVND